VIRRLWRWLFSRPSAPPRRRTSFIMSTRYRALHGIQCVSRDCETVPVGETAVGPLRAVASGGVEAHRLPAVPRKLFICPRARKRDPDDLDVSSMVYLQVPVHAFYPST